MTNFINKLKSNIKIIYFILFGIIVFSDLLALIDGVSFYFFALSLGSFIDASISICFFGLIIYALIAKKKEIYDPLIIIYFIYEAAVTLFGSATGLYLFDDYQFIDIVYSIFNSIYYLAAAVFAGFVIADFIFKKDFNKIELILFLVAAGAKVLSFIFYIIVCIVDDGSFFAVFNHLNESAVAIIVLFVIYVRPFSFIKGEEKVEEKPAEVAQVAEAPKAAKAAPKTKKPAEAKPTEEAPKAEENPAEAEPVEEKPAENVEEKAE